MTVQQIVDKIRDRVEFKLTEGDLTSTLSARIQFWSEGSISNDRPSNPAQIKEEILYRLAEMLKEHVYPRAEEEADIRQFHDACRGVYKDNL